MNAARACGLLILSLLGGLMCGGCATRDHSHPTLSIVSAHVGEEQASLDVLVENPGDHDLRVKWIRYELAQDDATLAKGTWAVNRGLPSKGQLALTRVVQFESDSVDLASGSIEIAGEIGLQDDSETGKAAIERCEFSASGTATRSP